MGLEHLTDQEITARQIYDWMRENICYDDEKAERHFYMERSPEQVLRDRKGICTEQSRLYIKLLENEGIRAAYVEVDIDNYGDSVEHACSEVYLPDRTILVDTCYRDGWDIKHKQIRRPYVPKVANETTGLEVLLGIAVLAIGLDIGAYMLGMGSRIMQAKDSVMSMFSSKPYVAQMCDDGTCEQEITTANGKVVFRMPEKSHNYMKESMLIKEMQQGKLSTQEIYELYESADNNGDNIIGLDEAKKIRDDLRGINPSETKPNQRGQWFSVQR